MNCIELNPSNNFDHWDPKKVRDLNSTKTTELINQELLFENQVVKVWEVRLLPQETLPFRIQKFDFCLISRTRGSAVSHQPNGAIQFIQFKKGDTHFSMNSDETKQVVGDLENVSTGLLIFTVIEFK